MGTIWEAFLWKFKDGSGRGRLFTKGVSRSTQCRLSEREERWGQGWKECWDSLTSSFREQIA